MTARTPSHALWMFLAIVTALIAAAPPTPAAGAQPAPGAAQQAPAPPLTRVVARVYFHADEELAALARTLDIWEVHRGEGYLVAAIDPATFDRLTAAGYRVEIDEARTARLDQPLAYLPGQLSGIPGYPCYRTVEETYASMQALQTNYPGLATWVVIGQSWEKLQPGGNPGYDLNVLILTNKARTQPKAVFFLMAEIHARELATAEIAARYAEYLAAGYGNDPDITWLLDYNEVHILVMTNPDGRKLAEQGYMQRKNTDDLNGGNCGIPNWGTDLNRNSGFMWGGAGTDPCDETYQGPSAVSEPETQALQNYVLTIFPDQRGPGITDPAPPDATGDFITLHSYGPLDMWPWGFTYDPAPNATQLQTLGRKFAYLNFATPQQSVDLYPTTGSSDDWSYGELGVASYTFEVGTDFFQDCPTFENSIYPSNRAALLYALKAARRPYQSPAGPDSLNVAVANGVVPGGTVTLTATADGTRYSGGETPKVVAAARFTVDVPSWAGGATHAMAAVDGTFDETIEGVTGTVDATGLQPGRHTVLVESQSADGYWGPPTACFLCVAALDHAVTLQPPSDTRLGDPGHTVTYALHVGNAGALTDTYDVTVSGNTWQVTVPTSVGPVGPCGGADFTVTVLIPGTTPAGGSDTATVTVRSQADATVSASSILTTTAQAGIVVSPTSGLVTSEAGGSAQFAVVLTAQPAAAVTVPLASSDTTEGTVAPASLTFTTANWNVPQTVTVTGVDDYVVDGTVAYTVVTGPATSADLLYDGLKPADVSCSNVDNDVAGFYVTPTSGLVTTEAGGKATFTVSLKSQPVANVSTMLSSSDTTEGTVTPGVLVFTPANWNVLQTATVTGVNDALVDGTVKYTVYLATATSTDPVYNGINPPDVSVENLDDESADLRLTVQDQPDPVPVNTPVTVTFTVTDRGMLTATNLTLAITLPANATLGTVTPSQGSCSGTGPVTCALGTLAMNGVATVAVQLTPTVKGTITTAATASSAQPDPVASDNTASAQTTVVAFGPVALAVDAIAYSPGGSNLNGVLEPGEIAVVAPTWQNYSPDPATITSHATALGGNATTKYVYYSSNASYGTVAPGATASCADGTPACFAIEIDPPAVRPAHFDAHFTETLSTGEAKVWVLHVGSSFTDVPPDRWAYSFIETLLHSGITAGCGDALFCPADTVTRWQMAVFLAKAINGGPPPVSGTVPGMGPYNCVAGGASVFADVPPTDGGCPAIHFIAARQITVGCGGGDYCPTATVSRWQMGVFLAKAIAPGEIPVSGTVPGMGPYDCEAGGTSVFGDVPPTDGGCKHIHYIAAQQITVGCGGGNYCPAADIARDQMAVFLTKAFHLKLYGP